MIVFSVLTAPSVGGGGGRKWGLIYFPSLILYTCILRLPPILDESSLIKWTHPLNIKLLLHTPTPPTDPFVCYLVIFSWSNGRGMRQERARSPTGILRLRVASAASFLPKTLRKYLHSLCRDRSAAWHPQWSGRLLTSSHRPTPRSEATELD